MNEREGVGRLETRVARRLREELGPERGQGVLEAVVRGQVPLEASVPGENQN